MNDKIISVIIGILLIASVGTTVVLELKDPASAGQEETAGTASSGLTGATSSPAIATGITSTVVAEHGSRQSCWSIINGNVYDLTSWVPQHPGGEEAILKLCGTDGSAAYDGKHGGASKQTAILIGFKIGVVAR